MDRTQRAARLINMRKALPLRTLRTTPVPETVLADLDLIDAATTDPAIREATARIRVALTDGPPTISCAVTEPHPDGGLYSCTRPTHGNQGMHFDEQRQCHWIADEAPPTHIGGNAEDCPA